MVSGRNNTATPVKSLSKTSSTVNVAATTADDFLNTYPATTVVKGNAIKFNDMTTPDIITCCPSDELAELIKE